MGGGPEYCVMLGGAWGLLGAGDENRSHAYMQGDNNSIMIQAYINSVSLHNKGSLAYLLI